MHDDATDPLALGTREGLPEALRVLLAAHPRESWAGDPEFHGLVALWLERHGMFRKLTALMGQQAEALLDRRAEPAQAAGRLGQLGNLFLQELHMHHKVEDMHYFPALVGMEGRLARGFEILDRDHHALEGIETLLDRHLTDEEDLIVPVILRHGAAALG